MPTVAYAAGELQSGADATDLAGMITATFESELSATASQALTGLRAIWLAMLLVTGVGA